MTLLSKTPPALRATVMGLGFALLLSAQTEVRTQNSAEPTVADGPGDLRLPDSASALPEIVLIGLVAVGAAWTIRSAGKRSSKP